MKPVEVEVPIYDKDPAAFRRLCVETPRLTFPPHACACQPPSGGCVLKRVAALDDVGLFDAPAAFRRLCVETLVQSIKPPSPQPAAFRRLCVETKDATI